MPTNIKILDYFTKVALSVIWKKQVQECITNDIESYNTEHSDDWSHVENTPFTEPFWGVVVNK